jgi:hypothetical protein
VLGIMAAILTSMLMERADDLFGGPQGSPRTEKLISASVQWAEEIMRKIDSAGPQNSICVTREVNDALRNRFSRLEFA